MADDLIIPGSRWSQTYQHSVNAILGPEAPRVHSTGNAFRNVDRWTARRLIEELCSWAGKHPAQNISRDDLEKIVHKINDGPAPKRFIQIAATPDKMPVRIALALTGGAYHEAFHTKYTRTRNLNLEAVANLVLPRWPKVKNWAKYLKFMMDFSNIVEDIRIERLGIKEYPGVTVKLHDLQDFALNMEEKGEKGKPSPLSIIIRTFRDVGLGYVTPTQRRAIERYKLIDAQAFNSVVKGPLTPALRETIDLSEKDDMGCLRVTMDIVILFDQQQDPPPQSHDKNQDPSDSGEGEDDEQEENGEGDDGSNGQGSENEQESTDEEGTDEEGTDSGSGSEEGTEAKTGGGDQEESPEENGDSSEATGAGHEAGSEDLTDWDKLLSEAQKDANNPQAILDKSEALAEALQALNSEGVEEDEAPYAPATTDADEIVYLGKPTAEARQKAKEMLDSVREETGYLRSRLRSLIRALDCVGTLHGVQYGRNLSEPFLVDTWCALQSGVLPHRAFYTKEEIIETSFAAAICIDESNSMAGRNQVWAAKIALAITDALDNLGCPVLVSGFRVSHRLNDDIPTAGPCHRAGYAIKHDVFKKFDERFGPNQWKFAHFRATGGTPMADGIEFSLSALEGRSEANRILFVVTDGDPDAFHKPVIKRQIRLAKEAGIHVVGVGMGESARYVTTLFPDYVWSNKFSDLPKGVVTKLNALVDVLGAKRGRTLRRNDVRTGNANQNRGQHRKSDQGDSAQD